MLKISKLPFIIILRIFFFKAEWRRVDPLDAASEFYWSEWGPCDKSCGPGKMRRSRECIRFNIANSTIEFVSDHSLCPKPKPGPAQSDVIEKDCFMKFCAPGEVT